jgi:hypothetical protein
MQIAGRRLSLISTNQEPEHERRFSVISLACALTDPEFALNAEDALLSSRSHDRASIDAHFGELNSPRIPALPADEWPNLPPDTLHADASAVPEPVNSSAASTSVEPELPAESSAKGETLPGLLRRNTLLESMDKADIFALLLKLRTIIAPTTILQFLFLRYQLCSAVLHHQTAQSPNLTDVNTETNDPTHSARSSVASSESVEVIDELEQALSQCELTYHDPTAVLQPQHVVGLPPSGGAHSIGDMAQDNGLAQRLFGEEMCEHAKLHDEETFQEVSACLHVRSAVLVFLEYWLEMFPEDFANSPRSDDRPDVMDALVNFVRVILRSPDAKFWGLRGPDLTAFVSGQIDENFLFGRLFKKIVSIIVILIRFQRGILSSAPVSDEQSSSGSATGVSKGPDDTLHSSKFAKFLITDMHNGRKCLSSRYDTGQKLPDLDDQLRELAHASLREAVYDTLIQTVVTHIQTNLKRFLHTNCCCKQLIRVCFCGSYSAVAVTLATAEIPATKPRADVPRRIVHEPIFHTNIDNLYFAVGCVHYATFCSRTRLQCYCRETTLERITIFADTFMHISSELSRNSVNNARSTTGASKSDRMSRRISVSRLIPHKRWPSQIESEHSSSLTSIEAATLAVELTLRLHYLFCTIPLYEFLLDQSKAEKPLLARSVCCTLASIA